MKLLGVKINNDLTLNERVSPLLKRGNKTLHALMRISDFLSENNLITNYEDIY